MHKPLIETPTVPEIDWDKLPGSARFIATDMNGKMWWYEEMPTTSVCNSEWWALKGKMLEIPTPYIVSLCLDWENSLQERPI